MGDISLSKNEESRRLSRVLGDSESKFSVNKPDIERINYFENGA
jgi:hypothetical protein